MSHFSYYYIIHITLSISLVCNFLLAGSINCTICLLPLDKTFSIDAWGNVFHTEHENKGIFCHSCSRIISQGVTQGGYIYPDGRHLCSLCIATAVNSDSAIYSAFKSVISQLEKIGILDLSMNIPIKLVDIHQLNQEANKLAHAKLKGFTQINSGNGKYEFVNNIHISILSGLPRVEFEAILAHELLHVWLHQNKTKLSSEAEEGFCNLGRYLIYNNDQTQFSTIHLQSMEKDSDPIYGIEYRKMKAQLKKNGWDNLTSNLMN